MIPKEALDLLVDVAEVRCRGFLARLQFERSGKDAAVAQGFMELHGFLLTAFTGNHHRGAVAFVADIQIWVGHQHEKFFAHVQQLNGILVAFIGHDQSTGRLHSSLRAQLLCLAFRPNGILIGRGDRGAHSR